MIKLMDLYEANALAAAGKHIRPRKTIWIKTKKGASGYQAVSIKNVSMSGNKSFDITDVKGKVYKVQVGKTDVVYEDPKITADRIAKEQEAARKKAELKAKKKAEKAARKPMSNRAYEQELKNAMHGMKESGDEDATYDVSQSLVYDNDLFKYVNYHYPEYRGNKEKIRQRIQWDLEAYI